MDLPDIARKTSALCGLELVRRSEINEPRKVDLYRIIAMHHEFLCRNIAIDTSHDVILTYLV